MLKATEGGSWSVLSAVLQSASLCPICEHLPADLISYLGIIEKQNTTAPMPTQPEFGTREKVLGSEGGRDYFDHITHWGS